jgi:HPr kinase/phosphorylase
MVAKGRIKQVSSMSVREFHEKYGSSLGMDLIGSEEGLDRQIRQPTINRPGLALAGFFTYFAKRRVQVMGNSEMSYLKGLKVKERVARFAALCETEIPCIILSRGARLEAPLLEVATSRGISVFTTPMVSMKFINKATFRLEWEFAPVISEHGCMVDVRGIGVLVRGESGTGKSEAALGLVERGASLVADDLVHLRLVGGDLMGSAPKVGQGLLEVRGLGIINAVSLFGVAALRTEKRLDTVVTLRPSTALNKVDRLGVSRAQFDFLGVRLPHVELPVAPGRDMSRLIEVVALDQKLRSFGVDVAGDFNRRLMDMMSSPESAIR